MIAPAVLRDLEPKRLRFGKVRRYCLAAMALRLFINPPWSPGGCEEGGKGGNHRNRPGFNITANSHPLVRSSQTVHTRDPPNMYISVSECVIVDTYDNGAACRSVSLLDAP